VRAILDTNVFISGLFFKGPPYEILKAWQNGKFDLVISPNILEEYRRVGRALNAKYSAVNIQPILEFITVHSIIISDSLLSQQVSKDPDDDKFITCALSSKSKLIVSGDHDLLDISGYKGIKIVKPRTFIDEYLSKR